MLLILFYIKNESMIESVGDGIINILGLQNVVNGEMKKDKVNYNH